MDIDEKDIYKYKDAKVLPTTVEYVHRNKMVEQPVYVDVPKIKEVYLPIEKIIEVPK